MATPNDFDHVDALIASALQINGRASWGAIARAIDVPERTVARRGQRLLDMGAVRVSTYLDTTIVGNARPLVIEIRTEAGQALAVAKAVAARADASSVSIVEGSGEIVCMLLPRTPEESARLLLTELPAIDGLVSTQASTVLRYFRSGFDWVGVPLSEDAVTELRYDVRGADRVIAPGGVLSAEDDALIARLAADGRASVVTLAAELGVSAPTVRRRLDALLAAGALHVRTEISPVLHGLRVEALTWLRVSPDQIEAVGEALGQHPAVRFCVSCTGTSQLMIDCLVADEHALFTFLTKDVAALGVEGIARTSVVLVPVRRGPMVLADT